MMNEIPDVTVVIPTMAEEGRRHTIMRAINSIADSSKKTVNIIIVVNGTRRSGGVEQCLREMCNVKVLSLDVGSLPLALLAGRRAVETPYYCFLDDDDEYLPGAIDSRVAMLESDNQFDFVITNGYRRVDGVDFPCFQGMEKITSSPFDAIFQQNWLASCGSLFRSDRIGSEYFEEPHPYVEWTWLAFKLCLARKNPGVLDCPTFRIYDTPNSASKTATYSAAFKALYQKMLLSNPPKNIVFLIRKRIGEELHCEADSFRKRGMMLNAWSAHLRSLCYPGGWRYLAFSRHLLSHNMKYES